MPAVSTTNFPQSGTNRSRTQAISEIASHIGGSDRPAVQKVAEDSLDSAVRHYNRYFWKFNRVSHDITLVASQETNDLQSDFKDTVVCVMVDSNSKLRQPVLRVDWGELMRSWPDNTGVGSIPTRYALRNPHEDGLIWWRPIPGSDPTYPTVRHHYFRRIVRSNLTTPRLNVPEEVDQAIFEKAVANFMLRKDKRNAVDFVNMAAASFIEIARDHRDFPDAYYQFVLGLGGW